MFNARDAILVFYISVLFTCFSFVCKIQRQVLIVYSVGLNSEEGCFIIIGIGSSQFFTV